MKNILIILTILLLFIAPEVVHAQAAAMPDTVQFNMNGHMSMEIVSSDYYEMGSFGSVDSLYALFLTDLGKIEGEILDKQKTNNFTYAIDGPYRRIQVNSQTAVANEVSFDAGGDVIYFQVAVFQMGGVNQIIFKSPTLDGFKDFSKISLDQLIQSSKTDIFPEGKGKNNHVSNIFYVENGNIVKDKTLSFGKPTDTIEISFGIGLGTVRSTLTPDAEAKIMVNLSKKGVERIQLGVSYEALFSFEANDEGNMDVRSNSFVNLIFARSVMMSRSSKRQMAGIKIGRTVVQDDNTFDGPAYKFSFYYEIGSRFTIEPGVIFEDNFKKAFPVLRLAISL